MWTVYRIGEDQMSVALKTFNSCSAANKYANMIEDNEEVDYGQYLVVRRDDGGFFSNY